MRVDARQIHRTAVGSAIEFGVRVLKVSRLVVMGHAQCGGVRALVPLRRDRFYVGPDDTLFRVPSVGVAAEVGASFFLFP